MFSETDTRHNGKKSHTKEIASLGHANAKLLIPRNGNKRIKLGPPELGAVHHRSSHYCFPAQIACKKTADPEVDIASTSMQSSLS